MSFSRQINFGLWYFEVQISMLSFHVLFMLAMRLKSWHLIYTLKCLSIGTPKTINFPFVSNEKLMIFRCSNIQAHDNEAVIYLNFGTPKNDEFSIWNKWKIYYF